MTYPNYVQVYEDGTWAGTAITGAPTAMNETENNQNNPNQQQTNQAAPLATFTIVIERHSNGYVATSPDHPSFLASFGGINDLLNNLKPAMLMVQRSQKYRKQAINGVLADVS